MTVGILAFQGDVIEHVRAVQALGCETKEVRSILDFDSVDALIIPGGESTVIAKFLDQTGLYDRIIERCLRDHFPVYGTCAGAILMSMNVIGEKRFQSMKIMDIDIERNAYGSQTESFEADLTVTINGDNIPNDIRNPKTGAITSLLLPQAGGEGGQEDEGGTRGVRKTEDVRYKTVHGVFIRAPKIVRVGQSVEVLASHQESPVLVRDGKLLASTFHPELANGTSLIHHSFLKYILS